MKLRGKVAIVTGGAVRIGRALSLALAREGIGVCLHYGSSREAAEQTLGEIRAQGVDAIAIQADLLQSREAAESIVKHALEHFGRLDILVNSAAIFEAGALTDTTEEQWDRHFAVNLKTPMFLCREFVRKRNPQERGHILNIADWRGERPAFGYLTYTLTKSGVITLTKILAQELAPDIQVNAIAPGAILPPPGKDGDHLERLARNIPLRRAGSTDELAAAALFLLRSDFVTGEVLHVTGGEQL